MTDKEFIQSIYSSADIFIFKSKVAGSVYYQAIYYTNTHFQCLSSSNISEKDAWKKSRIIINNRLTNLLEK